MKNKTDRHSVSKSYPFIRRAVLKSIPFFGSGVDLALCSMALSLVAIGLVASPALATKPSTEASKCSPTDTSPSLYSFKVKDVDGNDVPLSQYRGRIAVVVNTASKCGYTGQYKDLQSLFEKYKSKGVVVLGFPSNDFGGQEPGTNKEIKTFCELNYNVKFPLFSKGPVKGQEIQPVYKFLTQGGDEIGWNFEKFVVDRNGKVVGRFKSGVKPLSEDITKVLESQLSKVETAQCIQ